ncbi:hypothetical protein B5P43_16390 [Bacillus sp. SRB_336]|nr:hypothetical protein B5P43_16390 [Bacillus sp. SRB_336]
MTSPRQWLTPLGLAMAAVAVLTAGLGRVGFAASGPGLLNCVSALVFAGAAVPYLLRERLPAPAYAVLTVLMAAAVVGMRVADPSGEVIALFLLAAFAPLRPPRPLLAVITLVGMLAFNVVQLGSGQTALTLILATDAGAAFFFLVGGLLRRERQQRMRIMGLLAELEDSREAEKAASVAAERGRMARDMHDILAHTLSGLALHLEGTRLLARGSTADAGLLNAIDQAQQLSRAGLAEARRAVQTLRGEDAPGPELIGALVDQHRLMAGSAASYRTWGEPVPLSAEAGMALYRAAQEALSNVRKHAPGAEAAVELSWGPAAVELQVADTGGGLVQEHAGGPGYGVAGMRERAALAGGTATAEPYRDGFRVRLSLPYAPPPRS